MPESGADNQIPERDPMLQVLDAFPSFENPAGAKELTQYLESKGKLVAQDNNVIISKEVITKVPGFDTIMPSMEVYKMFYPANGLQFGELRVVVKDNGERIPYFLRAWDYHYKGEGKPMNVARRTIVSHALDHNLTNGQKNMSQNKKDSARYFKIYTKRQSQDGSWYDDIPHDTPLSRDQWLEFEDKKIDFDEARDGDVLNKLISRVDRSIAEYNAKQGNSTS